MQHINTYKFRHPSGGIGYALGIEDGMEGRQCYAIVARPEAGSPEFWGFVHEGGGRYNPVVRSADFAQIRRDLSTHIIQGKARPIRGNHELLTVVPSHLVQQYREEKMTQIVQNGEWTELEPAVAPEPEPEPKPEPKPRAPKRVKDGIGVCLCGCEAPTGSRFAPGHDTRIKGVIGRTLDGNPKPDDRIPEVLRQWIGNNPDAAMFGMSVRAFAHI